MLNIIKNLTILLLMQQSISWSLQGHSIIARIVELEMTSEEDKVILQRVYDKLNILSSSFVDFEQEGSLLEAAVVPDVLNFQFGKFLEPAHFKDIAEVYKNDNLANFKLPDKQDETASTALKMAKTIVRESLDPEKRKFIKNGLMDSLMLRYILHVTGDVHQPLHTISLYSDLIENGKIKTGDLGGNLIEVKFPGSDKKINFHSLWDNGFGMLDAVEHFPYHSEMRERINKFAEDFRKEYPRSYYGASIENLDHDKWIQESHELAVKIAYADIDIFPTLRPEYIIRCRDIVKQQMTLAGYRLTALLRDLFK